MASLAPNFQSQPRHSPAVSDKGTRLTELVLPSTEHHTLLLPMLQYLSNQDKNRWVTIISDKMVCQRWLKKQSVNTKTIRVIKARDIKSALWMTWEALANGTSHTVIAELGVQSQAVMRELELAADEGSCRVLLVRSR